MTLEYVNLYFVGPRTKWEHSFFIQTLIIWVKFILPKLRVRIIVHPMNILMEICSSK